MSAVARLEDAEPEPNGGAVSGSARRAHLENRNGYREARAASLAPWLDRLLGELAGERPATLAVRFVSDREMRRLNREYRGQDRTTDVLSFAGGETPEGPHLGDVAVCVPAARRQAQESGHSVETELRVLLIHGLLHCLGFDHETDDGEMARLERNLRSHWISRHD